MPALSTFSRFSRPLLVAVLAVAAILAISFLIERVDSARTAQVGIERLSTTVQNLEAAPFSADPAFNSAADARSPNLLAIVRREIATDEARINDALRTALAGGASGATVESGLLNMREVRTAALRVYTLASGPGG